MTSTQQSEALAFPSGAEKAARSPIEIAPAVPTKPSPKKENTKVWKEAKEDIEAFIKDPQATTMLLIAGTGTGKTFAGSQIALEALREGGKMAVAENLKQVTEDSSYTILRDRQRTHPEEKIGDVVGFQNKNRREVKYGKDGTRLLFCPIKTLLNKAARGQHLLEDYDLIMIDEVHRESIDNGRLLETLKDIQKKRANTGHPLKIILTSATMDEVKLKDFFPGAVVKEVKGENRVIQTQFLDKPVPMEELPKAAAQKVIASIENKDEGNFVVFLSGQKQIDEAQKELSTLLAANPAYKDKFVVVPYIGSMTKEKQNETLAQFGGKRVVVLATNAAQEGLTWDIKIVIDSGSHKHMEFDTVTGKSYLIEKPAPIDHLIQRKGRMGRNPLKPGEKEDVHYVLATKAEWESRPQHETPDIQRTDLTDVVLNMLASGQDPYHFDYLNTPPGMHIDMAFKRLEKLGAVKGRVLTDKGLFMAQLELKTNHASLVADGIKYGALKESAALAAMLETFTNSDAFEGNVDLQKKMRTTAKSDLIPLIKLLENYNGAHNKEEWATSQGLRADKLKDAADLYKRIMEDNGGIPPKLNTVDMEKIGPCGLDLAIHDSFADTPIAGFKKHHLSVEGVSGAAEIRVDPHSILAEDGSRIYPNSFISATIRATAKNNVVDRVAGLNHEFTEEAAGALYGLEHPESAESSEPKTEEDRSQKIEDRTEEAAPVDKNAEVPQPLPPPEPPKKLKWWQKIGNWFKKLFGRT